MNIIKSDNGFPYAWRAGRVEQLIRNILERKAQAQLDVDRVMLVNPTWLLTRDLAKEIQDAEPDFIICHNFVDPAITAIQTAIKDSGIPHLFIGNSAQYRLDFWAMVCDLNFRAYTEQELALDPEARKFICLNRKPHAHRQIMFEYLTPIAEQGFLSIGTTNDAVSIPVGDVDLIDADIGNNPIPNDIYTLGDLAAWQSSYLDIVTETVFKTTNPDDFFISEKTWKPVIGLRPFFVYGQPRLREYLKQQGFDIFEDIIDYCSLSDTATEVEYCELAVTTIQRLTINRRPRFNQRLLNNQQRFREYVYEQWNRLEKLNLKDYIND